MAPVKSSVLKLTPIAALLAAFIASTGCAMPQEPRVAYAAPALVEVGPGLWAVQDYPGYYYANGDYWYFADDGVWYERPYWGGPWAGVDVRMVPQGIVARAGAPGRSALLEPGGLARSDRQLHAEYSPSATHAETAAPHQSAYEHHR